MQQNYLLELDGKPAGRFFAFTGGTATAEVITERAAPSGVERKHIGSVKYQDMVLTCGTGMSRSFYQWVGNSLAGATSRQTGAVVALDHKQTPTGRVHFRDALVTSIVLPELNTAANKEAYLTVSISPEMTSSQKTDVSANLGVYVSALPKSWKISNFRLKIDGLETDCARVTHIGALTIGQKVAEYKMGEFRSHTKEPAALEYSNLVVRLPDLFADGFYKWYEDFVERGANSQDSEKNGTLEFFAPNSKEAYFGLELRNLGVFEIAGTSALRSKTNLPITVGMYCEGMKFYAGPSAII